MPKKQTKTEVIEPTAEAPKVTAAEVEIPAHNDIVSDAAVRATAEHDDAVNRFIKDLHIMRNTPEPVVEIPALTERQLTRRELEMKRGAEVSAAHAAARATEKAAPKPDMRPPIKSKMNPIKEGTNTEVFKPADYTHERDTNKFRTV